MERSISVIMGIYNCAKTLPEALDSLLAQTCGVKEIILCDDGSVDNTYAVAAEYRNRYPDKIILIQNERNMGLNITLNNCLERATGEYIARMDGDDVSMPNRFEEEIKFLDTHPECAFVSSPMLYFDENGVWGKGTMKPFPEPMDFVYGTPFCHAPCMVRAEAYRAVNGYSTDPKTMRAEDYDLWTRLYEKGYRGGNLLIPIYKMRDDQSAYNRRKFKYSINETYVKLKGYKRLGLPVSVYPFAFRSIVVGLLPKPIYIFLHHRKRSISNGGSKKK